MAKGLLNPEQQLINDIESLLKSPGWKVLEERIWLAIQWCDNTILGNSSIDKSLSANVYNAYDLERAKRKWLQWVLWEIQMILSKKAIEGWRPNV